MLWTEIRPLTSVSFTALYQVSEGLAPQHLDPTTEGPGTNLHPKFSQETRMTHLSSTQMMATSRWPKVSPAPRPSLCWSRWVPVLDGRWVSCVPSCVSSCSLSSIKSQHLPLLPLTPQAEQADKARYSVTQAIVEARSASGSPLQFSLSLYYGTVALGSEAGTAVKDRTFPSEILRIQAQYPGFPVRSSFLFTYEPYTYTWTLWPPLSV